MSLSAKMIAFLSTLKLSRRGCATIARQQASIRNSSFLLANSVTPCNLSAPWSAPLITSPPQLPLPRLLRNGYVPRISFHSPQSPNPSAPPPLGHVCTDDPGIRQKLQTGLTEIAVEVGGTLQINLLGVNAEVNVSTGQNLERVELQAWWNQGVNVIDENALDICRSNDIVCLKMQCEDGSLCPLSGLDCLMPERWCSLLLEAGKCHVGIGNLKEASLAVKTTGGSITLGELKGSKAYIESNGGSFTALVVSAVCEVRTRGGNISVQKALGTKMVMQSGGGAVEVGWLYGHNVCLSSNGGHMDIKYLQAQTLAQVSTDGGNVNISGLDGNAQIFSNGGDIEVQLLNHAKEVDIDAGGGVVVLYIASQLDAEVEHIRTGNSVKEQRTEEVETSCRNQSIESYSNPSSLKTTQATSQPTCKVRVTAPGNLSIRRRSWLEAAMGKAPNFDE